VKNLLNQTDPLLGERSVSSKDPSWEDRRMKGRRIRIAAAVALASGTAVALLIPDALPSRSVTYGPGIPSATHHRLGLRLAVFGVALLISALLLAASRMTENRRAAAE
jgi:hypothetical protein